MCNIQRIISQNLSKQTPSHLPPTCRHLATSSLFICRETSATFLSHKDWKNSFSHHLDLPIEGAVAGGIVQGERTLQGIHHSSILGGKRQLLASGLDAPAGHSPRSPGRLLWLSNGMSV